MIPYPPERVLAGVVTALMVVCHATGLEAHAQAGPKRAARARAASSSTRSRPNEGNERARALVDDGLRRAEQKDWVAALGAFDQALAISPQYGDAYIAMGDTYMDMGKYEEGFKAYRLAISVAPSNPDAHYSLGAAYNDMAQYGDAFKHFVQAIRLKPDFAEAHYGIGYAYLKLENYRDALVYLRRTVQLQPDYWEAHLALGQTYLGLRDVKAAKKKLKLLAGIDAAAAATLEKEIAGARGVAQFSDRGERDGRAESAPPLVKKSVTTNAEPNQGDPVRPAGLNQGALPARPPVSIPRPTAPSGDAALTFELSFWDSIKNSRDPEEFAAYLNKYPEGQFAELAKIRLRALAGKKEEAPGRNSEPKPPPPADDAAVSATSTKPISPTAVPDGVARQPKEQSAEEQPNKEQPLKEQPKEQPPADQPKSSEADTETLEAALDSLRGSLTSKFSYRVGPADEASAAEAATAEVSINYEPLKFEGCTVEWRDQKDTLRVSLSELDPEVVRVRPRSRPGTTFSIEVWDVSISAAGGTGAISEAKGDGSGTVNSYNGLDLQYDNREKAESLARALRQAIKLCGGKP